MREMRSKRAVLATLGIAPDFSRLSDMPVLESTEGRALLRWLDRSGLALYFWRGLRKFDRASCLPAAWSGALAQRRMDNAARTKDMLDEFRKVNEAFRAARLKAVALKGFTLVPDFCEAAALRHQADFDFLMVASDVPKATEVFLERGYTTTQLNADGETCFTTAMQRIPSTDDYLYAMQHQRQVDLHTTVWEKSEWLAIETPGDSMNDAERRSVDGVEFWALRLEDSFLFQVLHVFRHSLRSWIRLSWLLELGRCVELRREDAEFWKRVIRRAGESRLMKKVFGFVLGLAQRVFGVQMPLAIERWTEGTNAVALNTWLDRFALNWAATDWPGSLDNLFVTAEFIPDPKLRKEYWRSRLLPRKANTSIGNIEASDAKAFIRLQRARAQYLARRARAHIRDICGLPVQGLRWKRALYASRKSMVETNS